MSDSVHVAFAVDRGYFKQAAVTMASIVANAKHPERLRFHIVHAEDQAWVETQMPNFSAWNVSLVKVENPFLTTDLGGRYVSAAAMMKTLLPDVLPDLDRVIYVDADVVFIHDIEELWNVEIDGHALAGVIDLGVYRNLARKIYRKDFEYRDYLISNGIDYRSMIYVNSGMLYMNLNYLRKMGFSATAMEMNSSYVGKRHFVDQDIINISVNRSVVKLDARWNVLVKTVSRGGKRSHHYIPELVRQDLNLQLAEQWAIHYAGPSKPWKHGGVWGGEHWWRYARLSGLDWPPVEPRPRTAGQVLMDYLKDFRGFLSKLSYGWRKSL